MQPLAAKNFSLSDTVSPTPPFLWQLFNASLTKLIVPSTALFR